MSFGNKIIELRKMRGLSQTDLGKVVGVHKNVLGKYERDEVKPSIEIATQLAKALDVSLDYLVGNTDTNINPSLLEKLTTLQGLEEDIQSHIIYALEALLRDAKARQAYA